MTAPAFCPSCGRPLELLPEQRFCAGCGAEVPLLQARTPSPPQAVPAGPPAQAVAARPPSQAPCHQPVETGRSKAPLLLGGLVVAVVAIAALIVFKGGGE
jgi:hypothetical protein